MKYRLNDGAFAPGTSHGIGAGTSQVDNAAFFWANTTSSNAYNRHGILNERILNLNAGDQVRLYMYIDSGNADIVNAEMAIDRIR